MRRSSDETKAAILVAARERFGSAGFQAATIRAIAAELQALRAAPAAERLATRLRRYRRIGLPRNT